MSLKFVPKGTIDNKSILILVMVWCLTDGKPLVLVLIMVSCLVEGKSLELIMVWCLVDGK